ncbi:AAA family ATPase [Xenorhabdus szentirmaii]|uniref:AAA family ATPase n=1 Tax=Xenorhabdus szentirmaii TaxID=290112 RepID=UPI0019B389B4|nr:ATP-binding protein [Xenorhabdus sp. 38]MBD2781792.1 ATP-binding protein [Xenorhabdus sp. 38]
MSLRLKKLKIEKLFNQKDIELDFKDVTVLVGKNGLGKTTILKILNAVLTNDLKCHELSLCKSAELTFDTGEIIHYKKNSTISEELDHIIDSMLNKKEVTPSELEIIKIYMQKRTIQFSSKNIKERLNREVNICYISTLNMSANSRQEITKSDGRTKKILDWELEEDLKKLTQHKESIYAEKFEKVATSLFSDSGKYVKITNNESVDFYDSKSNELIKLGALSSGERQLIYILTRIANTQGQPTFLLMDEPEISLHLNWQEKLIENIMEINNQCQIVVVTHSPAIIMDGYMDSYVDIKEITTELPNG